MSDCLFSEKRDETVYDGILHHAGIIAPTLDRITTGQDQLREDDILVASFPKSGTHWALKILALLCRLDDLEAAHKIPIEQLIYYLEWTPPGELPLLDVMQDIPSPRVLKTHLPPRFFKNQKNVTAKKTKIVCIMRNPKDVLVSFYHFSRMCGYIGCFTGTWTQFFELYKDRKLSFGDWFDIVSEWWQYRDQYKILYLYYEDLQQNAAGAIRKVAAFIDQELSEDQLERILELSSFNSMRDTKVLATVPRLKQEISPFMRKGTTGDWKNYFTDEQNRYVDELYAKKIKGSGMDFKFEV